MPARIEIYPQRGLRLRWRYRIVGGNGERIAASQSYRDPTDATRGAMDLIHAVLAANATDTGIHVEAVKR